MFKVVPCAGKAPLPNNWTREASDDPEKLKMWANLYREKLTHWGVVTGPVNDLLVLDVDIKGDGLETIKQLQLPDTMCQRTPSGGLHYFFRYPKDGRRYPNKVKFLGGLDARGDGGHVCWYGNADITKPILEAPAWFTNAYSAPPNQTQSQESVQPVSTVKVAPEIAARIVQQSLDNIRNEAEGGRNHTLNIEAFKLGQLVASESITIEYAFEALVRAAHECGLPIDEARATAWSGLTGGKTKPIVDPFSAQPPVAHVPIPDPRGESWTPLKTTREELFDYGALRKPQLFQDWSTEDISITTADGGTGKTTLKLFEAVCLALGERFLGFNCTGPGKTLFITGEDTDKKLKAMLGQILKQMQADEQKIQTVLDSIYIKKDADLCLIVKDLKTGFLQRDLPALNKILHAVDEIRPRMIVFDPISSFWGSEAALNDMNKAVSKFMSELSERSGACVEMVNHMGKDSSRSKDMSQFAGRGGTGLPSHARVSRTLRSIDQDEYAELTGESLGDKQSAMLCNVNKFSDGSPLYNKPFLILRDGFLFSRKALTDAKAREAQEKLSDIERVFKFIKETRQKDKFATKGLIIAHFKSCGDPISKPRVEAALELVQHDGHLGEWVRQVNNPDQIAGGRVYVLVDADGKEQ